MANKHKGMVEIELDKKRNLRYTMNALAEIEDKLGVGLADIGNMEMTVKNVRVVLWSGLIHEDPELTEIEVGNMVDMDNFQMVQEKIAEAFAVGQTKNA